MKLPCFSSIFTPVLFLLLSHTENMHSNVLRKICGVCIYEQNFLPTTSINHVFLRALKKYSFFHNHLLDGGLFALRLSFSFIFFSCIDEYSFSLIKMLCEGKSETFLCEARCKGTIRQTFNTNTGANNQTNENENIQEK